MTVPVIVVVRSAPGGPTMPVLAVAVSSPNPGSAVVWVAVAVLVTTAPGRRVGSTVAEMVNETLARAGSGPRLQTSGEPVQPGADAPMRPLPGVSVTTTPAA